MVLTVFLCSEAGNGLCFRCLQDLKKLACSLVFCRTDLSDPATVNISDEMSKGSFGNVWKSVNPENAEKKKDPSVKR